MKTKKFLGAMSVVATAALLLGSTSASAAPKPASKATIGADCTAAAAASETVAKGLGVDGSDLTCLIVKTGGFKDRKSTRLNSSH